MRKARLALLASAMRVMSALEVKELQPRLVSSTLMTTIILSLGHVQWDTTVLSEVATQESVPPVSTRMKQVRQSVKNVMKATIVLKQVSRLQLAPARLDSTASVDQFTTSLMTFQVVEFVHRVTTV